MRILIKVIILCFSFIIIFSCQKNKPINDKKKDETKKIVNNKDNEEINAYIEKFKENIKDWNKTANFYKRFKFLKENKNLSTKPDIYSFNIALLKNQDISKYIKGALLLFMLSDSTNQDIYLNKKSNFGKIVYYLNSHKNVKINKKEIAAILNKSELYDILFFLDYILIVYDRRYKDVIILIDQNRFSNDRSGEGHSERDVLEIYLDVTYGALMGNK